MLERYVIGVLVVILLGVLLMTVIPGGPLHCAIKKTDACTYNEETCASACQTVGENKYNEGLAAKCPTTVGLMVTSGTWQFQDGLALRTETHRLILQNDGNFVIYRNTEPGSWTAPSAAVSASNTKNNAAAKAVRGEFTSAGILRLFNAAGHPVWTVSPPLPGNTLSIGADGKLQIINGSTGAVVWTGAMNSVPVTPGP